MEQERERGGLLLLLHLLLVSGLLHMILLNKALKHRFNIIDTPGHIDLAEVKRPDLVLDGAVVVFDGVAGVEPESEKLTGVVMLMKLTCLVCFINKLDRTGASFEHSYYFCRLSKESCSCANSYRT